MARGHFLNTALFWCMFLAGGFVLAPCLLLPAWLERQAQIELLHARQAQLAQLRDRLVVAEKQIDFLQNDPAYILRIAQREFGYSAGPLAREGLATGVPLADGQLVLPDPVAPPATPRLMPALLPPTHLPGTQPDLATFVQLTLDRHPRIWFFVDPYTRPTLMALGGGLILCALVLLGDTRPRAAVAPRRQPPQSTDTALEA
ncbi:MAG: septum formation initiator family protein [Phycisphaerales bacterium]|nr:septum formation initiator family protein [Phycisphaerales bacterium]